MAQIRIDMRSYRWIGYFCFAIALPGIVLPLSLRQYVPAIEFVVFALLSLYMALCSGAYTLDTAGLSYTARLGHWHISWGEINAAQFSRMGTLVLLGCGKRFALAPPAWWPRSCRDEAYRFVSDQLSHRNIVPTFSYTADYKWMKNTRVRHF
jgi:hypothetical protein